MSFRHDRHGDLFVPIVATRFEPESWPKGGCYPLAPFHNRIRNARFTYAGRTAQLPVHPDAAPNALHGMGSRAVWQPVSANAQGARIEWRHSANAAWPWTFRVQQIFALAKDRLSLSLTIENQDDAVMPAGLGWHPYFPGHFSCEDDARNEWPMDEHYLPLGHAGPVRAFSPPATAYRSGWSKVQITGGDLRMTISARELDHLVLHAPDAPYFCVEPVSHLAAAANEPERLPGAEQGGMHPLAPGHVLTAAMDIRIA